MTLARESRIDMLGKASNTEEALERLREVCGERGIRVIQGDDKMPCCVIYNHAERIIILRTDIHKEDVADIISLCI